MTYNTTHTSDTQNQALNLAISVTSPRSLALLDLDGTLFDTRYRTLGILREYAVTTSTSELLSIQPHHFADRDLALTLRNAKLPPTYIQAHLAPITQLWADRFFSQRALDYDQPLPGAADFALQLHARGAHIVYLTARLQTLHHATLRQLKSHGFPVEGTTLLTKPSADLSDLAYKTQTLRHVATLGQVTLAIDNEPENINLMHRTFPRAQCLWIETDHSSTCSVAPGVHHIKGFLRHPEA